MNLYLILLAIFLRGDYKYLFLLGKAYNSGKEYPNISFVIPPTSEARWILKRLFFHGMFLKSEMNLQILLNFLAQFEHQAGSGQNKKN